MKTYDMKNPFTYCFSMMKVYISSKIWKPKLEIIYFVPLELSMNKYRSTLDTWQVRISDNFQLLQFCKIFVFSRDLLYVMKNCCHFLQTNSQLANISSLSKNSTNINSPIQYNPGESRIWSKASVIVTHELKLWKYSEF